LPFFSTEKQRRGVGLAAIKTEKTPCCTRSLLIDVKKGKKIHNFI